MIKFSIKPHHQKSIIK